MLIREIKTEDFDQINKFLIINNKKPIDYKIWNEIYIRNPNLKKFQKIPMGWVVEVENNIVGFAGNLPKIYSNNDKFYFVSIFTTWVVNTKYRFTSLLLLKEYFTQNNIDIFINTTANYETYKIWKAMGANSVPLLSCQEIEFQIINCENFLNAFFHKKKMNINKFLIKILKDLFKVFFIFKLNFYKIYKRKFKSIITYEIDDEIGNLIEKTNLNKKYFCEVITKETLTWNINYRKKDKKYWITKIYEKNLLVGFSICFGENNTQINLSKCSFSFIFLNNEKNENYFDCLIKLSIKEANKRNYDIIEFRNLNLIYKNYLKKFLFFKRKYKHNPYLYKLNKNKFDSLSFLNNKENWSISLLDGDILFN